MSSHDYDYIERAIEHLEDHWRDQPSLPELAHAAGMSEFHFQRVFTRWVGISPKRFVQFQTIEHAKALLRESRSVLDVSYETGLSGGGRLHDLFVSVEAVTPGEYKSRGAGVRIEYGFHDGPFGESLIGTTERGICSLEFVRGGDRHAQIRRLAEHWEGAELVERPREARAMGDRIFHAWEEPPAGGLSVLLKGTNFQIRVWEALLRIPMGALVTYEDVATAAGSPRAIRAAGSAVGDNPISWLIPCHRVIRKSGALGGYGGGLPRKRAMLGYESARVQVAV